jgi:excisionase family DNA binding protein
VSKRPDPLAALDAIPRELLPAAMARLMARVLEPVPSENVSAEGDRLLTPDEAAARLGVHRRWIYQNAEQLRAVKLSHRRLRIPASALDRYLVGR